jgi:hypothetical protein
VKILLFKNPIFREGLNVTVRNGIKWNSLKPGEEISVRETGKEDVELFKAKVLLACVTDISELPNYWLTFEHDGSCATVEGIKNGMDTVYGEGNWGPIVTVVMFVR